MLDGHPVAVISYGYWQRSLGGASDAVGRRSASTARRSRSSASPRREFFGTTVSMRGVDAWVPLMMQPAIRYGGNASSHEDGDTRKPWPPQENVEWLNVFARVPRGTEPSDDCGCADGAASRRRRQRAADGDADFAERLRAERIVLAPAGRGLSSLRDQSSTALYVLLAMMIVLLLIASGNVASLLVARATVARARDCRPPVARRRARPAHPAAARREPDPRARRRRRVGLGLAVWGRDLLLGLFVSGQTYARHARHRDRLARAGVCRRRCRC